MIYCFDGMPVTWTIGTSPDADLVNTMLDQAIAVLPPDAKPIVHSDRGCHYRWSEWILRMQNAGSVFHVKERIFSEQLCLRGIFQALKKRDVLQPFLAWAE